MWRLRVYNEIRLLRSTSVSCTPPSWVLLPLYGRRNARVRGRGEKKEKRKSVVTRKKEQPLNIYIYKKNRRGKERKRKNNKVAAGCYFIYSFIECFSSARRSVSPFGRSAGSSKYLKQKKPFRPPARSCVQHSIFFLV